MKALRDRTPAVKKLVKRFNKLLGEYLEKFPNQTMCDSLVYPLKYEEYSKWPLDHHFWNDGLDFQTKAPWAINPNVRAGINYVLILARVQEEVQLLAQELAWAIGWGVSHYTRFSDSISYINQRIIRLDNENDNNNNEDVKID
ncbi:hypothetical protein PCASD_22999 [Puccinia coronata f. sp. avenae]|uniref:Uncharacterized protein n=1 Tax=Puccinia coronata f. sp. avenae TaxID=200324 RepID=A0A2N5TQ95_9BASI|nr:hypothetical protein PCASD_25778 [Puccinia coronata f. sp. avenae]PLW27677.1 hypothetical protein PCASD_22999 [Puccinia coronata f. sp. avenae]